MSPTTSAKILTNESVICENCWFCKYPTSNKNSSSNANCEVNIKHYSREFNKGVCLIKNGEPVSGIYCIQKGNVKISKKRKENKEFILWIASAGDIIGLNSYINHEAYSFTATALDKISACFISCAELKVLLSKEPMLLVELTRRLCKKLNFVEHRITSLSTQSIRGQCAEILISIATDNTNEKDKTYYINYSVRDLASLVGTTQNYLYKILLEFTTKGILSVKNKKFIINDINTLSLIANGID